jgi:hypothetical protein
MKECTDTSEDSAVTSPTYEANPLKLLGKDDRTCKKTRRESSEITETFVQALPI